MNVTIVGVGNAGCAMAYFIASRGHQVNLLKTSHNFDENFEKIQETKSITAIIDGVAKTTSINIVSRDPHVALNNTELIIVVVQSLYQESVAELVCPNIPQSVKALVVLPGNLGSLYFRKRLSNTVLVGEGESMPYDARIVEPGVVNICFINVRNAISFIPSVDSEKGLKLINEIIPTYVATRNNIVESAMHNPNLIVHTVGTIMSANRIEYTNGEFWMYREAFTPSIWNLIKALDEEKNTIIEIYKGKKSAYLEEAKWRNETDLSINAEEVFRSYANNGGPKGPFSVESRYLVEDVSNGLVLLYSLGVLANIETPITKSLISIASCLVQKNFFEIGRTLEKLGITSKEQLLKLL